MRAYKPRRMPRRYLDGAPEGVLDLFDDPKFADRYTVIYREVHDTGRHQYMFGRSMSADPFHPQGVGLSFEIAPHELRGLRDRDRRKRIAWADLPERVQKGILKDLEGDQ